MYKGKKWGKRILCALLSASIALSGMAVPTKQVKAEEVQPQEVSEVTSSSKPTTDEADGNTSDEGITEDVYNQLGLPIDTSVGMDTMEPIVTSGTNGASVYSAREIYSAANGSKGNRYTVRDGFNKLIDNPDDNTDINENGKMVGAYKYWDINDSGALERISGNANYSQLNQNDCIGRDYSVNSMKKENNNFSGIYATSTEFNRGAGKDNYIAELRAYGDDTKNNGKTGKLGLQLYTLSDSTGDRVELQWLDAGIGENLTVESKGKYYYFWRRYIQELDAVLEVEAADVDGDGIDELFAYYGGYVDENNVRYACVKCYKQMVNFGVTLPSYSLEKTIKVNAGDASNYDEGWSGFSYHPIVTLAGGDLDGNGKEEICITVSAPTGADTVADKARAAVYAWNDNARSLEVIPQLEDISLANSEKSKAMVSTNCTFGKFTLPGTTYAGQVLMIAGYETHNNSADGNDAYTNGAYRCVYYDYAKKKYVVGDYTVQPLGDRGKMIASSFKTGNDHYRPVHAPLPLACADLEGMTGIEQGRSKNMELCYGGDIYEFDLSFGFGESRGALSLCTKMENHNENSKDKEQVWISDVQTGCIDTEPGKHNWRESFIYVSGVHRDDKVNGSDDYYWMNIGAYYQDAAGNWHTSEEGVIMESNRRNDKYGTFISLCLPDIQDDSIKLKYIDKVTNFTNPQVYAVLQAGPYFEDLNELYDYIGNGGTAYSTSKSEGSADGATISASAGLYTAAEVQLGGTGEYEMEIGVNYSYDFLTSKDLEYSIEYNNQSGSTDKVVLFCMPVVYYKYLQYNPENKKWEEVYYTRPLSPVTSIIDVEEYDSIAAQTPGLETIGGNLLKSTPGAPETYTGGLGGENVYSYNGDASMATSKGSGADITQTISHTETTENSHTITAYMNGKIGAGVGFAGTSMKSGITISAEAGYCKSTSSSEGISYSGTVDNLPSEADKYSFSWKLMVNRAYLNGRDNPVWIVGYDVKDVIQLPKVPKNLSVTEVTDESVKLTWEAGGGAHLYELYMVDALGERNMIAMVPGNVTEYTVSGLDPDSEYEFTLRAGDEAYEYSIFSPSVTAKTLAGGNFEVITNPQNQTTYSGGTARFEAVGRYINAAGKVYALSYKWQVSEDGGLTWKALDNKQNVSGVNSNTLKLSNVTSDMNNWLYRAKLYYLNQTLYTEGAKLVVDKANSLSSIVTDEIVYDQAIINASGVVRDAKTETVYETEHVSVEKKVGDTDTLFLLYANSDYSKFYWSDGETYYKNTGSIPTETYTIDDAEKTVIHKDATVSDNCVGSACEITENDYKVRVIDAENQLSEYDLTRVSVGASETITINETLYQVNDKWKTTENNFVYQIEDEENSSYYYDGNEYLFCTISSTNYADGVAITDLEVASRAVEAQKTTYTDVEKTGDTVTLRAKAESSENELSAGNMTFNISGSASQTIKATYDASAKCYTAQWKPTVEGTFYIAAKYDGDDKYYGSTSETVTVHTVMDGQKILTLTAPYNVTYGNSARLMATKIDGSNDNSAQNVTATVDYSVQKLSEDGRIYMNASAEDYTLDDGVFLPKKNGQFLVKVTDGKLSDSAVISVNKGKLTILPDDQESAINKERKNLTAKLSGYAAFDEALINSLSAGVDYQLTSNALSAQTAGEYAIYPRLCSTEAMNKVEKLYNITLKNGVYKLTANSYVVNAETDNRGTVEVAYENGYCSFKVESGDAIAEGSRVTVQAIPEEGYKVARWKVDGEYLISGSSYVTASTYTVDSLNKDVDIEVEFADITSVVSYEAQNVEAGTIGGTVTGFYNTLDGIKFSSGSKLAYNQRVVVKAVPEDGYVVDHWTVKNAGETDAAVLKATDGSSVFTGASYTFAKLNKDTEIIVYFAKKKTIPVTVKFVDNQGNVMSEDVAVNVNGTNLESDESGIFGYEGQNSDNLTISIDVPDNLIIDSWKVGEGQTTGNISDNNRTMTVYNLQSNTDFTISVSALNSYTVSFLGKLVDESAFGDNVGQIKATKVGVSGKEIESGASMLQGATIVLEATPKEGYEIDGWLVNGKNVQGKAGENGVQTYQISSLSGNVTVAVVFRQKPQIVFSADTNGNVTVSDKESGYYVEYGDKSEITFTATPDKGYEVEQWTVNGESVEAQSVANSDNQTYTYVPDAENGITENINVAVTCKAIPTTVVSYGVVDQNGDVAGGTYGELALCVNRKDMESYAVENDLDGTEDVYRGSKVTFNAMPESGYRVGKWFVNGVEQLEAPELTIESLDEQNVQVQFAPIGERVSYGFYTAGNGVADKANLTALYKADGSTETKELSSGTKVAVSGNMIVAVSDVAEGYEIEGWYVNGVKDEAAGTNDTFSQNISVGVGVDIAVKIIRSSYLISYNATCGTVTAQAGGVEVANQSTVVGDTKVTFTASPVSDTGYTFAGWKVNGEQNEEESEVFVLDIVSDTVVEAVYTLNTVKYSVTYTSDENGTVTAMSNEKTIGASPAMVDADSSVTFTANPADGYMVEGWYSDAAKTQPIEVTSEYARTYTVNNITKDLEVFVAFKEIPEYNIQIATVGLGKVTAKVNDEDVEIVDGAVKATCFDSVVLTAVPDKDQSLISWIVNGEDKGNKTLTYSFENISSDISVTAKFNVTAFVELKVVDAPNGTLSVETGYGEDFTAIDAKNGVEIPVGQNVKVEADPAEGHMVKNWMINGVTQDNKSTTMLIEDINENTLVEVEYEPMKLWNLPEGTSEYTICEIERTPEDYGTATGKDGADQICDGGEVSFKLVPSEKDGKTGIVETMSIFGVDCLAQDNVYPVTAQNESKITCVKNEDGSYTITVGNVKDDIVLDVTMHYHEYIADKVTKPTCTQKGYTTYKCECGESYQSDYTDACGHKAKSPVVENNIPATYKAQGSYEQVVYCSVCHKELSRVKQYSDKLVDESLLLLKVKTSKKNAKLEWEKVDSADGYVIKYAECKMKWKTITIKKNAVTRYTIKNLKKDHSYRFIVSAYQIVNGKKVLIKNSNQVHVAVNSKKYANVKKVKVDRKSVNLKLNGTKKIKVSLVKDNKKGELLSKKHGAKISYISSDTKIATVNKKGKIKAVGKGTCYVYVIALNGTRAKIKVTVK